MTGAGLKRLFFVRHGETEWNAVRRMQGQWNSDLNERGRRQAEVNGKLLAGLGIQALFASPLDRTRQTAEIIGRHVDLPVVYDERIKEWDCGVWSGQLYDDVAERWPQEWSALLADRFHYRGPGCENYPDMMRRAGPFLEEIQAQPAGAVAIVSHGMIGRVMVSMLLGYDEQRTLGFHQPNDVVFRVTLGADGARVHHYVAGAGPLEGVVTG